MQGTMNGLGLRVLLIATWLVGFRFPCLPSLADRLFVLAFLLFRHAALLV